MSGLIIPEGSILRSPSGTSQRTRGLSREELLIGLEKSLNDRDEYIRRMVCYGRRTDILCNILGFDVAPELHAPILKFVNTHPWAEVLSFRGSGKSTIAGGIFSLNAILSYPNIAIAYVSRTQTQARRVAGLIKNYLGENEIIHRIFGDGWVGEKWSETEFTVGRRTKHRMQSTFFAVGVGGPIAGLHVDLIIFDDITNEKNTKTPTQREAMHDWMLKEAIPTLDPATEFHGPWGNVIPFTGEAKFLGVPYHPEDESQRLAKLPGFRGNKLEIRGFTDDSWTKTPWKKRSVKWMMDRYELLGRARFECQFMCRVNAMLGDIFPWDILGDGATQIRPGDCHVVIGADPAADGTSKESCEFAVTVVGVRWLTAKQMSEEEELKRKGLEDEGDVSVILGGKRAGKRTDKKARLYPELRILDHYSKKVGYNKQIQVINKLIDKWGAKTLGIESNGMQLEQYQRWRDRRPDISVIGVPQRQSKVIRAHNMAALFESGAMTFQPRKSRGVSRLIDQLLQISPTTSMWDRFDSLDIGVQTAVRRRGRGRNSDSDDRKFGVIGGRKR